jgi:hypothetical protein
MRAMLAIGLILTLSGCAGPLALRTTRQKYNAAIEKTNSEQLLLNLVRLRYRDPTAFMELTSLSTQFVFDQSVFANGQLDKRSVDQSTWRFGGAISAAQRPTVTYDMLQGQKFVRRLISPMSVDTVLLLIRSGWSADRVLRITVQQMNGSENARSASGPTPDYAPEYDEFQHLARIVRHFQMGGQVRMGYESSERLLSGHVNRATLSAEDIIAAAKEGWSIHPRQENVAIEKEKIEVNSSETMRFLDHKLLVNLVEQIKRHGVTGRIRVRLDPQTNQFTVVEDALTFLACMEIDSLKRIPCIVEYADNDEYVLTGPAQSLILSWDPSTIEENPETHRKLMELPHLSWIEGRYKLEIEPRSLMGTLYYLSHAIQVPQEHAECGLVTTTVDELGEPFDWGDVSGDLLQVHSQKRKPEHAAVSVKYRGHWFYINDSHLNSKSTFTLLLQLFELQAGGGAEGTKPVLTLSVGQ